MRLQWHRPSVRQLDAPLEAVDAVRRLAGLGLHPLDVRPDEQEVAVRWELLSGGGGRHRSRRREEQRDRNRYKSSNHRRLPSSASRRLHPLVGPHS
jgi:hypothetical protein